MSYDEVERQNCSLSLRTIEMSGKENVPLPPSIVPKNLVQAAIDNFDHEEATPSPIGGSHDTIMVVFQNIKQHQPKTFMSKSNFNINYKQKSLTCILPCQILKKYDITRRAEIPTSFTISERLELSNLVKLRKKDYLLWILSRYHLTDTNDSDNIMPSWSACNSARYNKEINCTRTAFIPILPHPATSYDSIFTSMLNFQNIMKQTENLCGALWCDEGVYHIAREIQLLSHNSFDNIFLGLGGFHMEKVVMACLGKYLKGSGIDKVLTNTEIYGPISIESVLNGGHYADANRAYSLIAETLFTLQLDAFFIDNNKIKYDSVIKSIVSLQNLFEKDHIDQKEIDTKWSECLEALRSLEKDFENFVKNGINQNVEFAYWNHFLTNLYPVLRDLTRSHREGDWLLHVNALQRALPLFFCYNRTNYARWGSLYYEDCLKLPVKFPDIYETFQEGFFVVNFRKTCASAVPMDQALEKAYNKPAKGQGGIIGFTRRKEAVAQFNLIRHEKARISTFLRSITQTAIQDEYTLHHEFSESITKRDVEHVTKAVTYIRNKHNPFSMETNDQMKNLVTEEHISPEAIQFSLDCISLGTKLYEEFVETRYINKTKKLFDRLPRVKVLIDKKLGQEKKVDLRKETMKFCRKIDIARSRHFDIYKLLSHEILENSYFLTKDNYLRKPEKHELVNEMEKYLSQPSDKIIKQKEIHSKEVTVIDFMAYARKIPLKSLQLKSFADFANHLQEVFLSISRNSQRLDIIFDVYVDDSIKAFERNRRSSGTEPIEIEISHDSTPIPVDMSSFWGSSTNKVKLQQFFIKWLPLHSKFKMTVYLGGSHLENVYICTKFEPYQETTTPIQSLYCEHEEADDRLLYHINHAIKVESYDRVIVASPDTDVFVCLVYHFNRWIYSNLNEIWMIAGQGHTKRYIAIHDIVKAIPQELSDVLPAVHSLTGCDTTSKISTKYTAIKAVNKDNYHLLTEFGKSKINFKIGSNAEEYLVNCLNKSTNAVNNFNDLRYYMYHQKNFQMDVEKLPCTSSSIQFHILRSYLQCFHWLHAPFQNRILLNPIDFGYNFNEEEYLVPIIVSADNILPTEYPMPCNCIKCSRENVCSCRSLSISCSEFCKCKGETQCCNPHNQNKS